MSRYVDAADVAATLRLGGHALARARVVGIPLSIVETSIERLEERDETNLLAALELGKRRASVTEGKVDLDGRRIRARMVHLRFATEDTTMIVAVPFDHPATFLVWSPDVLAFGPLGDADSADLRAGLDG